MRNAKTIEEILNSYNSELFLALSKYRRPAPPQFPTHALFSNGKAFYMCSVSPFPTDDEGNYGFTKADFERCGRDFLAEVEGLS